MRSQATYAHCKLLARVSKSGHFSAAFEGSIFPAGAVLTPEQAGESPVVVECVGPVGKGWGHKRRSVEWILWKYEWEKEEWRELARTQAEGAEWTLALREPAISALCETRELYDVKERGRELLEGILEGIDQKLDGEQQPVKIMVLGSLYDRVAGKIANLA